MTGEEENYRADALSQIGRDCSGGLPIPQQPEEAIRQGRVLTEAR